MAQVTDLMHRLILYLQVQTRCDGLIQDVASMFEGRELEERYGYWMKQTKLKKKKMALVDLIQVTMNILDCTFWVRTIAENSWWKCIYK